MRRSCYSSNKQRSQIRKSDASTTNKLLRRRATPLMWQWRTVASSLRNLICSIAGLAVWYICFMCVEKHHIARHTSRRMYVKCSPYLLSPKYSRAHIHSQYGRAGISNDWRKIDDSSSARRGYCITSAASAGTQPSTRYYSAWTHWYTNNTKLLFYYTFHLHILRDMWACIVYCYQQALNYPARLLQLVCGAVYKLWKIVMRSRHGHFFSVSYIFLFFMFSLFLR